MGRVEIHAWGTGSFQVEKKGLETRDHYVTLRQIPPDTHLILTISPSHEHLKFCFASVVA